MADVPDVEDMTDDEYDAIAPASHVIREIAKARNSNGVLTVIDFNAEVLSASDVARALHKLAVNNKRNRAGRDALLRDRRFEALIEKCISTAPAFDPRSVADVLWSFATLQHWPPTLLKPLLTAISVQLTADSFSGYQLATIVWALAKLQCKPTKLLEQIEQQAIPKLDTMDNQNCANLVWGLAKLNYKPPLLLPPLSERLLQPGMLDAAKPVEVSDVAFALGLIGQPRAPEALLLGLAERAAPDPVFGCLHTFSSRQIVLLIWAFASLQATPLLPEGRVDAWVSAVKAAHAATPLLASDARNLERSLVALGIDAAWIKQTEMLSTWSELAAGKEGRRRQDYTEEELRATFVSIDTDNSGDIDREELLEAIRAIKPDADDGAVEKMLSFGDADGDMAVSFEEFKKIMQGMSAEGNSAKAAA